MNEDENMKRKKLKNQVVAPKPAQPELVEEPLTVSLRLPGNLAARGKAFAVDHGISLNALLCLARRHDFKSITRRVRW